jgi:RNase P subunit RPR2
LALVFIPNAKEYIITSYSIFRAFILNLNEIQLGTQYYPAWIFLLVSIFIFISIITLYMIFKKSSKTDFSVYTKDFIYGAKWKWKWQKGEITNLQCYCPKCDTVLVYDDTSSYTRYTDLPKTDFICESCSSQLITSIHGGNKNYAFNAVKREIERRIRINEYKVIINK